KVPPTPRKPLTIVTPEQFDAIYQALPDAMSRLLVEADIESGLRWGELAELRAGDVDLTTGILTVTRTVMELNPKYHPTGGPHLVKAVPKEHRDRPVQAEQAGRREASSPNQGAALGRGRPSVPRAH